MTRESIAYYSSFYQGRKLALLLTSSLLVLQPIALMATLYAKEDQFDRSLKDDTWPSLQFVAGVESLRDIAITTLRLEIGVVPQHPLIFQHFPLRRSR